MAQFEAVVWALLVSLGAWLVISGRVSLPGVPGVPVPAPHPRYPTFEEYDAVSPLHRGRAVGMLARFAGVYQRTFDDSCNREMVVDMHELRSRALSSLYEIRMRLPNDAERYDALTRDIEKIERSTLIHIDDVTDRCQLGRIHTKPVHDHYYAHHYRAANDREL